MIRTSKICPLEVLFRLFDQIFLGPKLFKGERLRFFFFFDAFNILWAKGGLLILIFLWNCALIPVLRPISQQKQCSASAHSRFSSNSGLKPIKLLILMFKMIRTSKICPLEVLFRLFDQIFLGPKLFKGERLRFFFFFDAFNILWAKGGLLILIFLWNCPLIPVLRPIS